MITTGGPWIGEALVKPGGIGPSQVMEHNAK